MGMVAHDRLNGNSMTLQEKIDKFIELYAPDDPAREYFCLRLHELLTEAIDAGRKNIPPGLYQC